MALSTEGWTPERVQMLQRLVAQGLTASRIAIALNVTRGAVAAKCYRDGYQLQWKPGNVREKVVAAARREPNLTAPQITRRVGCSTVYVYTLSRINSLPVRRRA